MRRFTVVMLAAVALGAQAAKAQAPARFYWKSLSGANAVPVIVNSISGNSNPFDPSHVVVSSDAQVGGTMALAGYGHIFTLFGRSAIGSFLAPMGRLSGEATVGVASSRQSTNGFGDPMGELVLNIIGPPAQKSIPDAFRYTPGFSVDLLADLAVPVGKYDTTQALNLGQNRWYGRVGAPVIWQLGGWVPTRRTTLELLPAVWLFGPNDNYVGQKLETEPLFQLDAHLTRDFAEHLWGSLDATWYNGGAATVAGVKGEKLNNYGFGASLGTAINDNVGLTVGYKSTVADRDPGDLRMDTFTVSLVYGWHPLIEGVKRLGGGN